MQTGSFATSAPTTTVVDPASSFGDDATSALRTIAMAVAGVAATTLAAWGVFLLTYIFIIRAFTPPQQTFIQPLPLDFAGPDMVAHASFLSSSAPPGRGFLRAGQSVDVCVDLMVPGNPSAMGMAQVMGEILAPGGQVAAKASQPVLIRPRPWRVWWV
jgi:hypothetical protein